MAIKLTFGEPHIISQGPTYGTAGWGTHQFPTIHRMPDGRLVCGYHVVNDASEDYGKEKGWAVSSDNGVTWQAVSDEGLPAVKSRTGTRLPSGRYLRNVVPKPFPIDDELHSELQAKAGHRKAVAAEEVPDLFPKSWLFNISEENASEEEAFYCDLDFPGMTMFLTTGAIVRPFIFSPIKVAPDGTLWIAHYANGRNPGNMGFTCYYACYYFQSGDEGRSWKLKSWIPYLPDTEEFPEAFDCEGFCEPDICWMPDGSMITVMRTGSFTPSYIARSTDGGSTWSKPWRFDSCGVYPQLLRLECGVTLCSYGRPAMRVRATADRSGMAWEEPYELKPWLFGRQDNWDQSCYYTGLLALDGHTALMVYSDFYFPDADGVERKSVMCRTITVEK